MTESNLWAGILVACVLALLWIVWVPKRQVEKLQIADAKERMKLLNESRDVIGKTVGSLVLALGFGATISSNIATQQSNKATQEQALMQRYGDAVKLLSTVNGNQPAIESRIGAVNILESVVRSDPSRAAAVYRTLAAYIEENASISARRGIRRDVEAAMQIIGRREGEAANLHLRIHNANLSYFDLSHLSLVHIDLFGSWFYGTHLEGATLMDTDLSFTKSSKQDPPHLDRVFVGGSVVLKSCQFANRLPAPRP